MSSKGMTSVCCKSNVQIHYSWTWGTCLVPPLSLSCCGWWCASHTSMVSLMLPWRVTKLSVLSRWHWMCCITGKRCCAREWFSWKLSTQSWNNFISQKPQPPFAGWSQVQSVRMLLRGAQGHLPVLGVGRWGEQGAGQHQPGPVCCPHASCWALFISGGEASSSACYGSPSHSELPSRGAFSPPLWLKAGCCWADTWGCEAVLAPVPAPCSRGPWLSCPAHCTASVGKEAHTAETGKVPWGPDFPHRCPKNPTSLFSSALPLLSNLPCQPELLEGSLTAYRAF